MFTLDEQQRAALTRLCQEYAVARLELVGSALTERFDPQTSDLHFLVEFRADSRLRPFHQFFDLHAALEALFGRPVELIEASAIRNPYFAQAVRARRELLYAA